MYCKIFPSQQVYDGIAEMTIACDNVFVTDGWICLYKGEKFVASFDMVTINGWVLIDSTADTPQTEVEDGEDYLRGYNDGYYARGILDKAGVEIHIDKPRGFTLKSISDTPQTERSE